MKTESIAFAICALVFGMLPRAEATVTMFGPSPYLQTSDSPFYAGIQAGTIYLEDFEDGVLDTPFIIINDFNNNPANGWIATTVRTNNPNALRANSVDEDDGLLGDFKGFAGDALTNNAIFQNGNQHEFLFTPDAMGRYPNYVGFVVTDPEDIDRNVEVTMKDPFDEDVLEEEEFDPRDWTGGMFNGDTRRHRFIGAYSSTGIQFLQIRSVDELDHLQYGYAIPEPATVGLLCLSLFLIGRRRR